MLFCINVPPMDMKPVIGKSRAGRVMAGKHDGRIISPAHLVQDITYPVGKCKIKPGKRVVEQQQLRPARRNGRQGHQMFLAETEGMGRAV